MPKPTVLISGAGIAGLTLASWLDAYGFAPTLIDKRSHLDDQGYMIDFYGSGFDVAEKMGLLGALRARHYSIPTLTFVGRTGRREAVLNVEAFRKTLGGRHFNFMRGTWRRFSSSTLALGCPFIWRPASRGSSRPPKP